MKPSHYTALLALSLALALSLGACTGDVSSLPVDDDDSTVMSDDDDSAMMDDDDDSAVTLDDQGIRYVTFAASLDGSPEPSSSAGSESTMLSGHFQFIYWSDIDTATIVCRQHLRFEAVARFGTAQSNACEGCGGQLSVMSARADDEPREDDCPKLPSTIDLSFLLTANDITVSADFRELSLISLDQLVDGDWQISGDGLGANEVEQGYLEAGLDAYWIAMVGAHGWLAGKAALGEVASPWDSQAPVLPMFVAYRNPTENSAGWALDGRCFLSTLWAVRVGETLGANPLP
jgi:hypothetical protein